MLPWQTHLCLVSRVVMFPVEKIAKAISRFRQSSFYSYHLSLIMIFSTLTGHKMIQKHPKLTGSAPVNSTWPTCCKDEGSRCVGLKISFLATVIGSNIEWWERAKLALDSLDLSQPSCFHMLHVRIGGGSLDGTIVQETFHTYLILSVYPCKSLPLLPTLYPCSNAGAIDGRSRSILKNWTSDIPDSIGPSQLFQHNEHVECNLSADQYPHLQKSAQTKALFTWNETTLDV